MKRDSTCMEGERGRAFVRAVPPEAARVRSRRPPVATGPGPPRPGVRGSARGVRDRGEKEPCGLSPFPPFSSLFSPFPGSRDAGRRAA